jgi:predicted transcriptional regulator
MADRLEDLDPIFATPPSRDTSKPAAPRRRKEEYTGPLPQIPQDTVDLSQMDEVFRPGPAKPAPAPGTTVQRPTKESPIDKESAALAGAATGYALNKKSFPKIPERMARIQELKATSTIGQKEAQSLSSQLQKLMTQRNALITALEDAQEGLVKARALAEQYNLPTEISEPGTSAGDKWSRKTVGSMGPGAEATTEAARNYRLQQELEKAGESGKFKAARSGLVVPNKPEFSGQFTSPAQENAFKQLQQAQARFEQTSQALNQTNLQLEQLQKSLTGTQTAAAKAGQRAQILEEMNKPSMLKRLGYAAKNIPLGSVLGGGMAGYEGVQAYEAAQRGDLPEAAMHGLSAAGGALMTIPHPIAKGAGLLMSAPPLAYELYKGYKGYTGE